MRERTAELEQLSRLKDEFLATMSHELRTPLNAIFGWVTLLRTRRLDEPTQERALETIERNARAQKRLIEDLLDVSTDRYRQSGARARHGRPAPGRRGGARNDASRGAGEGHHDRAAAGHGAGTVRGDFARLQQVVCNLLSNAIKFTPAGGRVEVSLTRAQRVEVEISVSDSGQGIKPEFLPLVFDRFRQEDGSISRRHGGLGPGPRDRPAPGRAARGIGEAHSEGEGKGSRFCVAIPSCGPIPKSRSRARESSQPAPHLRCLGRAPAGRR